MTVMTRGTFTTLQQITQVFDTFKIIYLSSCLKALTHRHALASSNFSVYYFTTNYSSS